MNNLTQIFQQPKKKNERKEKRKKINKKSHYKRGKENLTYLTNQENKNNNSS